MKIIHVKTSWSHVGEVISVDAEKALIFHSINVFSVPLVLCGETPVVGRKTPFTQQVVNPWVVDIAHKDCYECHELSHHDFSKRVHVPSKLIPAHSIVDPATTPVTPSVASWKAAYEMAGKEWEFSA